MSAYRFTSFVYLALPAVALLWLAIAMRRGVCRRVIASYVRACTGGGVLGVAVAASYASVAGASVPLTQIFMACWDGIGAALLVLGCNHVMVWIARRVGRMYGLNGFPRRRLGQGLLGILHIIVLVLVGIPVFGALLVVYRPKAPTPGTPMTLIDAPFEHVRFAAMDDVPLDAWWIPATTNGRTDHRGRNKKGRDTVLFCHGFAADKASQLYLVQDLVANGYNVLAIDLRAHGRSAGQLTGFGGLEARDVRGAIRWLKRERAQHSARILGLGESLGAVALIEAASGPSPEGQAIDAVAAYNPYGNFSDLVDTVARDRVNTAGRWIVRQVVVPLASLQIGGNLSGLRPGEHVRELWPRPLLVIGNSVNPDLLGKQTYDLFRDASQPKYGYWSETESRDELLRDPKAA